VIQLHPHHLLVALIYISIPLSSVLISDLRFPVREKPGERGLELALDSWIVPSYTGTKQLGFVVGVHC
jgi:hypothetical protein